MQRHKCAFVSVLEEYTGDRKPGTYGTYSAYVTYDCISKTFDIYICLSSPAWLDTCKSTIIYERKMQSQVLYVVPITSVLGRLPVVPVGTTGTIPYSMHKEGDTFSGASCDISKDAADGGRWWYINTLALKWAASQ